MDAEDIREMFAGFGPVSVRRMFGGAGVFVDGTIFALIVDGVIYLKTDAENAAMFEREGLEPFSYARRDGERAVMSYRRMPDRLYDDPDELAAWARAAHGAALRAAAGKPVPKPSKRRRAR
jgi:DNA transformation protein